MAFSPEKEDILRALIARYDGEKHTVNGKAVYVIPDKESSGAAEAAIAQGHAQADDLVARRVALGRAPELRDRPADHGARRTTRSSARRS